MQGSKWLLWVTEHWSKAMRFANVDTLFAGRFLYHRCSRQNQFLILLMWICAMLHVCRPGSSVGLLMCIKLLVCLHVQGSGHWRDLIIKRWNRGIFVILCYTVKNHKSVLVTGLLCSQNRISKKIKQTRRQHCFVAIWALNILCRRLLRLPLTSRGGCV